MTKIQFNQNISLERTEFKTVEDFFLSYIDNFTSGGFFEKKVEDGIKGADSGNFASQKEVKNIFNKYL